MNRRHEVVWSSSQKTADSLRVRRISNVCFEAHPKVVCKLQSKDGDALIVERTCYGARDVTGNNGNETSSQQPGSLIPQLSRQQEGGDGSQATEDRSQEHTHVTDVHGDMEQVQEIVD